MSCLPVVCGTDTWRNQAYVLLLSCQHVKCERSSCARVKSQSEVMLPGMSWGLDKSKWELQLAESTNGRRPRAHHQLRQQLPDFTITVHHSWGEGIRSAMWKSGIWYSPFPYAEEKGFSSWKLPHLPGLKVQPAQSYPWEQTQVCSWNRAQEQTKQKSSSLSRPSQIYHNTITFVTVSRWLTPSTVLLCPEMGASHKFLMHLWIPLNCQMKRYARNFQFIFL